MLVACVFGRGTSLPFIATTSTPALRPRVVASNTATSFAVGVFSDCGILMGAVYGAVECRGHRGRSQSVPERPLIGYLFSGLCPVSGEARFRGPGLALTLAAHALRPAGLRRTRRHLRAGRGGGHALTEVFCGHTLHANSYGFSAAQPA